MWIGTQKFSYEVVAAVPHYIKGARRKEKGTKMSTSEIEDFVNGALISWVSWKYSSVGTNFNIFTRLFAKCCSINYDFWFFMYINYGIATCWLIVVQIVIIACYLYDFLLF